MLVKGKREGEVEEWREGVIEGRMREGVIEGRMKEGETEGEEEERQ